MSLADAAASPYLLAERVLAGCRGELGLPTETRVEFHTMPDWGEFDPAQPKLLKLSDRHLEPEYQHLIPRSVAHEAMHASIYHRTRDGTIAPRYVLDADLNEDTAATYADQVAYRWRTILNGHHREHD